MPTDEFQQFYAELQQLAKSRVYPSIAQKLTSRFDPTTRSILSKWQSNSALSADERSYIDLLSQVESSLVRHCLSIYNKGEEDRETTKSLPGCLFRAKQIKLLEELVTFIREEYSFPNDDGILVNLMRMLDARTLAYRLCFADLDPVPVQLNDTFKECLNDRRAKACFDEIILPDHSRKKLAVNQHRFFIGCATFAVALFGTNRSTPVKQIDEKYVYRLAKFVRVILKRPTFERDELNIYCLRGVLALLSNCIAIESWLQVINVALVDPNNFNAQRKNPFNVDFFSSIIYILLGSKHLQENAQQSESNDQALLVDIALVFLDKWCYTSEDDEDESDKASRSVSPSIANQVLHFLRSTSESDGVSRKTSIILPYMDAKYDRIRLMTFAILVNVIDYDDFKGLEKSHPGMPRHLVDLSFSFLSKSGRHRSYKGISFDLLLRYLFRFLIQDLVKTAAIRHLPELVRYAQKQEFYALRIIYRISTCSKLKDDLAKSVELTSFLATDAKILFEPNPSMKKLHEQIQANLASEPELTKEEKAENQKSRQAFISYCHKDKLMRQKLCAELEKAELFTTIWVDETHNAGNMFTTIPAAISRSQVVFLLLSVDYCNSDICRLEFEYTVTKKKPMYFLFVQKEFKQTQFDWVDFVIGKRLYYRIEHDPTLAKLIKDLNRNLSPLSTQPELPVKEAKASASTRPPGTKNYLKKRSVEQWTSEDILEWCYDNAFDDWAELLRHYDGKTLLALHQTLSVDVQLSNFITINKLNIIEVVRFKHKLAELLYKPLVTQVVSHERKSRLKLVLE